MKEDLITRKNLSFVIAQIKLRDQEGQVLSLNNHIREIQILRITNLQPEKIPKWLRREIQTIALQILHLNPKASWIESSRPKDQSGVGKTGGETATISKVAEELTGEATILTEAKNMTSGGS